MVNTRLAVDIAESVEGTLNTPKKLQFQDYLNQIE